MIKNNLLRKQYTLNETNYQLKIPMELDACIPANDCVRLIRQFVEEMDLTALYATYERMPSEKYASPEIMLKIMLYAYHERKDVSSRTIEKNCKRDINYIFLQKTALLVGDIIQRQELKPLWQKQVKKKHVKKILKKLRAKANEESLEFVSGRGHIKTQLQRDIEALEAALEKLKEYEKKLHICADRGSYAKTDPDATFMHMKDDHMLNGQLKPAYNLQHAVNSGFIVAAGIFPNPTDVMTLKPFLNQMEDDLSFAFERIVCDAGYESEENLSFLRAKGIEAYIKPANYAQIGTKKFAKEIGRKENMRYDKEQDCYLCHNGKEIKRSGSRRVKTASGYIREETQYACSECGGCPYKEKCMSGKNWKKPLEERYKKLTVSRLFEELREEEYRRINSEEGKKLRLNRSIQAEGGFADIKGDSGFTRFLCKGNENVFAEYILYAMAHNLGWLHSRIQNDKLDLHLYELKEDETEAA